ncbi:homeobox-leucine zipper protein ROC2-like [Neltuma alba]|uniref:homeobox-leucine zipper protein ROC2-like n=1 Tax=Neltuma alba TaxID=207710 RepID=UPI0010A3F0BB|nr:homeobox-leucine zipper protein ROC2-like [Prosopis alba]
MAFKGSISPMPDTSNEEGSGSGSTPNPSTEQAGTNSPERASDLLLVVSFYAEPVRTKIIELSGSAMDELTKLAVSEGMFWQPKQNYETLDAVQYIRHFGNVDGTLNEIIKMVEIGEPEYLPFFNSCPIETELNLKQATPAEAYEVEASRDSAYVRMNPIEIAEWLMDVEKWSNVFYKIVSRAMNLGILLDGVEGSLDGRLQVMSGEFHVPSALVRTRECYFARYSKKLSDTTWAIVDVSLEKFFPHPSINIRRRPSGCFIQFMPHQGFSKITWVEHVEADNRNLNSTFKDIIKSGFAFGATRWVSAIVRQYEYSQTLKAKYSPPEDAVKRIGEAGRMGMVKVGDRMMRKLCSEMSGAMRNQWFRLPPSSSDIEDVRVAIREHEAKPGKTSSTTLIFSTSQWFPIAPRRLFDFLRSADNRPMWDLLSRGFCVQELSYVAKGKDSANRVSLLQVTDDMDHYVINYIQESHTDISGSYVVYAPMDKSAVTELLEGGDPEKVGILPSGFAILPDEIPMDDGPHSGVASILTVSFHIFDYNSIKSAVPSQSLHVIKKVLRRTFEAVKAFVFSARI